ncbi:hypothetical protein AURDEDRAFT_112849, partial [Auricularia subglabra TFB-10046 SS5]
MRFLAVAAALLSVASAVGASATTVFVSEDPSSWQRQEWHGAVGDSFSFILPEGTSHALVQMSFDAPCVPLKNGFNTGATQLTETNFTFEVVSTDAVYIGCGVPGHCHKAEGSSINAPITMGTQSLTDWLLDARKTPEDNSAQTSLDATSVGSGTGGVRLANIAPYERPAPSSTSTSTPVPKPPTKGYPTWVVGVSVSVGVVLVAIAVGVTIVQRRVQKDKEAVDMAGLEKGKVKEL